MRTIVIYHRADFDGLFCREIARKFLPEAELVGWDYGDPEPCKDIMPEDRLFILDLSVPSLMDHPRLIWIDHHKSAIDKYDGPKDPEANLSNAHRIDGYRIDGVAACRLAWQWFQTPHINGRQCAIEKQDFVDRKVDEPLAVRLAGEYDIWDKRDPDAELFQHGLRSIDLDPHWNDLLSMNRRPSIDEIESLISVGHDKDLLGTDGTFKPPIIYTLLENGRTLQYVQTKQNESIIKAYGFTIHFEGLTFLACNHARFNSHLFTAGLRPEHDGCFGFNWSGTDWRVSLYGVPGKPDVDLAQIAVKYGGGGHKQACGFRIGKLPFL